MHGDELDLKIGKDPSAVGCTTRIGIYDKDLGAYKENGHRIAINADVIYPLLFLPLSQNERLVQQYFMAVILVHELAVRLPCRLIGFVMLVRTVLLTGCYWYSMSWLCEKISRSSMNRTGLYGIRGLVTLNRGMRYVET